MSFPHCSIGKHVTFAGLELLHAHGPLAGGRDHLKEYSKSVKHGGTLCLCTQSQGSINKVTNRAVHVEKKSELNLFLMLDLIKSPETNWMLTDFFKFIYLFFWLFIF